MCPSSNTWEIQLNVTTHLVWRNKWRKEYCNSSNKEAFLRGFITQLDLLDHKDLGCMVCQRDFSMTVWSAKIISMTGSAQHELARWFCELLQPALHSVSEHVIVDSFTFADAIRSVTSLNENSTTCSYDIASLFTNVPLTEVIEICAELLYHSDLTPPPISESVFVEVIYMATRSVEFSFNDSMSTQIDGVAMGSPLGPILANIFVCYCEKRAFADPHPGVQPPSIYCRYVDDIFAV